MTAEDCFYVPDSDVVCDADTSWWPRLRAGHWLPFAKTHQRSLGVYWPHVEASDNHRGGHQRRVSTSDFRVVGDVVIIVCVTSSKTFTSCTVTSRCDSWRLKFNSESKYDPKINVHLSLNSLMLLNLAFTLIYYQWYFSIDKQFSFYFCYFSLAVILAFVLVLVNES